MKYGVVVCKETLNIGDDIQSYAASLLLPQIDYYIEREHLDIFRPAEQEPVNTIINGWLMNNKLGWPISPCINPLYISMHITAKDNLLVETDFLDGIGREDLKSHEPIGCRDIETQKLLESKGINTWFSGCITLTLPSMEKDCSRQDYICLTDVSDEVAEYVKKNYPNTEIRRIEHEPLTKPPLVQTDASWQERFKNVKELLTIYQNAKAVITTRLHCAMPCLALQTPVLLLYEQGVFDSGRFSGLSSLVYSCQSKEFLSGFADFDLENPPANKNDYLKIRNKLIDEVNQFIYKNKECTSAMLERFKEYDGQWEKRALWKDQLCLKLEKKHLNRWRTEQSVYENLKKEKQEMQQEICKLKEWSKELERGKQWISEQNEHLINENTLLHNWTQEQDKAKTWLLDKISALEKEQISLWTYLQARSCPSRTEFHNIISLGYNCEVSFRIREHYGKLNSTIYSWCYISNRNDFLRSLGETDLLANNEKYLESNGMFRCQGYDIMFHTKVDKKALLNENTALRIEAEEEAQKEMAARYSYLSDKFKAITRNKDEYTLFILKMQPWKKDVEENKQFIIDLTNKLKTICAENNFNILIVLEKKIENLPLLTLENNIVYFRFVENYANDDETEKGGDIEGWNKILNEFKLIK